VRDFLRTNRNASAIITTVILVMIGALVGFTRDTGTHNPGVVLRADEQSVQPGATVTVPSAVTAAPATTPLHPPLTLGKLGQPVTPGGSHGSSGGSATTSRNTTATTRGGTSATTQVIGSAFGPDRIAYSAGGSLWTIDPDGTDARTVTDSGFFAAWAPGHNAIAFADANSPGGGLYFVNAAGQRDGLTTGVVPDSQPSWSPDGTKVAFARIDTSSTDGYSGIWVIDRDGSNLRRVAVSPGCFNRDPSWSPDGTKIAFWSSRDHCSGGSTQGNYELYVMKANKLDGTDPVTRLGTASNSGAPAWSPDGKTIAFSSDGYGGVGFEICFMAADGSKDPVRVTNLSGDDTDPAWSPDGAHIAFRSDRDGGGVFVMKWNGADMHLLVAGATQPSWA
jgi:TolB protein